MATVDIYTWAQGCVDGTSLADIIGYVEGQKAWGRELLEVLKS